MSAVWRGRAILAGLAVVPWGLWLLVGQVIVPQHRRLVWIVGAVVSLATLAYLVLQWPAYRWQSCFF